MDVDSAFARYTLLAAAQYLRIMYFSDTCKRNEGWGEHDADRQAWIRLRRMAEELK